MRMIGVPVNRTTVIGKTCLLPRSKAAFTGGLRRYINDQALAELNPRLVYSAFAL